MRDAFIYEAVRRPRGNHNRESLTYGSYWSDQAI